MNKLDIIIIIIVALFIHDIKYKITLFSIGNIAISSLEYPIHYFPAECWSLLQRVHVFVFICIEIAFKYNIPYTNVRYF